MPKRQSEFNSLGWRLFFRDRPTTLYYVCFTYKRQKYYKIGITVQTIKQRFASEPVPYEILFEKRYASGMTAYNKEQSILKKYKAYSYWGADILKSGNTELFTRDIKEPGWQD